MNQISLYATDTPQNGFNNNGLAVLCPSSCTIREKINDEYSLTMEHPIDEDGIWRTISAFTHIKALGQIFDVKTVTHDYTGRSGKINVYAEHVFYKINDPWIFPESVISGSTSNELIQSAMTAADAVPFPGSVDYTFSYDSDITVTAGYTRTIDKGCTLAEAIIGSGGIQETFGGELYRNNFYFSLKQRMEGSLDNAFEIRVGLNMKGVKRTVDVETFCSYFRAYDHLGQWFAISYDASAYSGLPIQNSVVRSQNFSYDTDDPVVSMENLEREADFYWWKHLAPKITYEVDLRDTRNNPDFSFISNPYRFKVGDYGRIYDDRLGGALELRITETETDALTGEVTKVVFGDLRGFVKESGFLPVPEFPIMKKIIVEQIDNQTRNYFDTFEDTKAFLNENTGIDYKIIISEWSEFTQIPSRAFQGCTNLVSIELSSSIVRIQMMAFEGCTGLTTINTLHPTAMTYFGTRAFYGCENLSIELPSALIALSDSCFVGCSSLTTITIPKSVNTSMSQVFMNCTNLREVLFEEDSSVTQIGQEVFKNDLSLLSIVIPPSVRTISSDAFTGCSNLESITINKQQGSISGSPWGATNATVVWTG